MRLFSPFPSAGQLFDFMFLQSCFCSLLTPPFVLFQEKVGCFKKTLSDFTSLNYWVVRDYYRLVDSVNALEPGIQRLSDEQVGWVA